MINKKNIWFLTLFSLILVLSVYYITMPEELLVKQDEPTVEIKESEVISALRIEEDEMVLKEMDELKLIISSLDSSTDEKNEAFNKMKKLNIKASEETKIEENIKKEYDLESFVKVNNDQIKVVIKKDKHDVNEANKIMRYVQSLYEDKKYITVEYK